MRIENQRRVVTLVIAVAAVFTLQGCAAAIGPYSPQRASVTSRSMTSRYDVLRQQSGSHRLNVVHEAPLAKHTYW
jgi:hypothetical protein